MATYNFLDYNGLERLLQSINDYYASKAELSEQGIDFQGRLSQKDTALRELISSVQTGLETALQTVKTDLKGQIDSEESSRIATDTTLQDSIDDLTQALNDAVTGFNAALTSAIQLEASTRETADNNLQGDIDTLQTTLDQDLRDLSDDVDSRLNALSDTLSSTLRGYIDQEIADLVAEGIKDIIIIHEGESLPSPGEESFLYITPDHAIHQWVGISEEYPEGWKTLGEDSAAEITALTDRVTSIEGQIIDVNDRLDYTVDTETYEEFINSYTEKVEEIDQAITEVSQSITGLETAVASKISGITVNDEPVEIEDGIAHITVSGGGGGEGTDPELRADFEAFKAIVNPQLSAFSGHLEDWENPHHVSKADLELDQVNNTSDEDKPISTATQAALDTKVDSITHEEDLAGKISYGDIVDDLATPDPERPLSANQGVEIDAAINEVKSSITALEAGLVFKGTVPSYNDLPVDAQNGFCYQIFSSTSDAHHGEIYAMTETGWVQIVASAQDMSSLIASQAEINKIITDYR